MTNKNKINIEELPKISIEFDWENKSEDERRWVNLILFGNTHPELICSNNSCSHCCGRCDGVNDICVTDMVCEIHNIKGCEECYGNRR